MSGSGTGDSDGNTFADSDREPFVCEGCDLTAEAQISITTGMIIGRVPVRRRKNRFKSALMISVRTSASLRSSSVHS